MLMDELYQIYIDEAQLALERGEASRACELARIGCQGSPGEFAQVYLDTLQRCVDDVPQLCLTFAKTLVEAEWPDNFADTHGRAKEILAEISDAVDAKVEEIQRQKRALRNTSIAGGVPLSEKLHVPSCVPA